MRTAKLVALSCLLACLFVSVVLAQGDSTVVVPPGGTSALGGLALAVLLPVAAWISAKLYDGIKTIIPAYDKLPAIVHQVAAPAFQFLFGMVASATGAAVLTDIHAIDAAWVGGILNMLLAAGIKRWEKSKAPVDTTVVMNTTRAESRTV